MEYPLMLEGKRAGTVAVRREGLFTVFEAQCSVQRELLRLSVYGQGREGYLGIMEPRNGGLFLRRKLSRTQMKCFPERIEYAAPAGLAPKEPRPTAKQPSGEARGLCWQKFSDGSLVCRDGRGFIIALPAKLRAPAPGAVLREIEGQLYMLFRY